MKRTHLAILLLLLLVACGDNYRGIDVERYFGTNGLVIELPENAPPEEVWEGNPFPVKALVTNKGAHNVTFDRMLLTFSTDPVYLAGGITPYDPKLHDSTRRPEDTGLMGRSLEYPGGEERLFDIPPDQAFLAKPVLGLRESPTTTLGADLCFAYRTTLATEVCIDTNIYQQNLRAQPCKQEDLEFTEGQGAPIAVTKVEVEAVPIIDTINGVEVVQPRVTLHLKDVGTGSLLAPDTYPLASACLLKGVKREDLGAVKVSARLFGTELECAPSNIVKIPEGEEGIISCTVPEQSLSESKYQSVQNFRTVLQVDATYFYSVSASRDITIKRLPEGTVSRPPSYNAAGEYSGYYYVDGKIALDEYDRPITKCEQYANDHDSIPDDKEDLKANMNANFACDCGQAECTKLYRDSRSCFQGLCVGVGYCCDKTRRSTTSSSRAATGAVTLVGGKLVTGPDADADVRVTVDNLVKYGLVDDVLDAARSDITPAQILAVLTMESKGNPNVADGDGGRAVGIGQFWVDAARDTGLCDSPESCNKSSTDGRKDPERSIHAIAKYLAWNQDRARKQYEDAGKAFIAVGYDGEAPSQSEETIVKLVAAGYHKPSCIQDGRMGTGADCTVYPNKYWGYYIQYRGID